MATLRPGYTGYLLYKSHQIRLSSGSVNVNQSILGEPTVFGLRDARNGANISSGKFDSTPTHPQNTMYRPSVKEIIGEFSFMVTSRSPMDDLFRDASRGENVDFTFHFNCNQGTGVTGCKISSFNLSCSQGGYIECSISFMGMNIWDVGNATAFTQSEKICLWTNLEFSTVSAINHNCAESVNFSIENPVIPIYTSGTNFDENLLPRELRIGVQNIFGTISFYERVPTRYDITTALEGSAVEYFTIGIDPVMQSKTIPVRYHPVNTSNNISVVAGVVAFTAVDFFAPDF